MGNTNRKECLNGDCLPSALGAESHKYIEQTVDSSAFFSMCIPHYLPMYCLVIHSSPMNVNSENYVSVLFDTLIIT